MLAHHASLIQAVSLSPIAMVLANPRRPDNPLEVVNEAFCLLTGYPERDIIGRNCRFLAARPGQRPFGPAVEAIRSALRDMRPLLVEVLNFRRSGEAFRNGLMISPILGPDGDLDLFIGSQTDLGPSEGALDQRQAEAALRVAGLPRRRREVLALMARGLMNKQIAWNLGLSERTVKMHRALLLEDLGVTTSAEAIRLAVEAGV